MKRLVDKVGKAVSAAIDESEEVAEHMTALIEQGYDVRLDIGIMLCKRRDARQSAKKKETDADFLKSVGIRAR